MTRCSSIKHQAHVLQRCPRGQESWSKQTNCQEGASKRLPKPKAISERCPDIYNKMARKNTIKTISRCVKRFNMCQDMSRQWWLLWLRWNLGNHTSRWLWMLATPCLGDAQWLWRIATAVKSTQRTANSMVPIRRAFFAGLIFHNICRVLSNVRHLSHTGTSEKSCAKVQSLSHMPFSARDAWAQQHGKACELDGDVMILQAGGQGLQDIQNTGGDQKAMELGWGRTMAHWMRKHKVAAQVALDAKKYQPAAAMGNLGTLASFSSSYLCGDQSWATDSWSGWSFAVEVLNITEAKLMEKR